MPRRAPADQPLATAARWPLGIGLTSWRYMWRTTPVHRWEMTGSMPEDAPPSYPADFDLEGVQQPQDGVGPLIHRIYRTRIGGVRTSAEQLMEALTADLNQVAPSEFASFQKVHGEARRLAIGDEYLVRMPGPWNGPVRVVAASSTAFRLVTLEGHLEAGQIEFSARCDHRSLEFSIESWARSGDRLSDLMYSNVRMAKEVQLHMWTSVLERLAELAAGKLDGGIVVTTRRLDPDDDEEDGRARDNARGGTGPGHRRARSRLAELSDRGVNFDHEARDVAAPEGGWRLDDMVEPLPHEPPGPPVEGGSWQVARELMLNYQVADPAVVRASYRADAELAGRDMLLQIRFLGLRFHVGVRIGEVYEGPDDLDGRQAHVFGWYYQTLEGHFEQGQMHYEVWKWLDTGDVEFRLHAFSRVAEHGPALLRLGFRLLGRQQQLRFYRTACRRMRRLTEAQLEIEQRAEPGQSAGGS